ncbi:MAG: hypothetical protein ACREEL_14310 [Stellaceae bacterium]
MIAIVGSVALAVVTAPMIFVPATAFAKMDPQLLAALAGAPPLTASQLNKQRGGFYLPNGALVNFGLEVQQIVNHTVMNDLTVDMETRNHFTVTQTQTTPTGGTTTTTSELTSLPNNGFTANTITNNGQTKLTTTVTNGAIQTLVQNTVNNQAIQTVTTLNVSTQGFQSAVHNVATTAQIFNTIQMNSWMHH